MNVLNQSIEETVAMYNGDCVELSRGIPDNSIHYTIFSPPFSDLYTYSDSDRDMGNSFNDEDFFKHFKFLVDELYRITMPGRLVSFHCMDLPATKQREGFIGLKDFPGELIRVFEDAGFHYHSRVTIWKDPLVAAVRTKAIGLLHKQIVKDSSLCRQGIADYLITMRKPGDNEEPIAHPEGFTEYIGTEPIPGGVYSHQVWRRYASPVWMDIDQSRTLNAVGARDEKDEKHIAPLQLDVIERAINLWTNKGDIVLDPFAGIGSTAYCAIKSKRRSIGFELKKSYYDIALQNIELAKTEMKNKGAQQTFIEVD